MILGWFRVGFGIGFAVPPSEQTSRDSPTKSLSKWGVYRCPSLSVVKCNETVAQGRQDTPSDTGRSTNAIGVSHLFGRCTESRDLLPQCKNADADANTDAMHAKVTI